MRYGAQVVVFSLVLALGSALMELSPTGLADPLTPDLEVVQNAETGDLYVVLGGHKHQIQVRILSPEGIAAIPDAAAPPVAVVPEEAPAEPAPAPPPAHVAGVWATALTTPTGLAIDPANRRLYVKSGVSGRVWAVPILSDGRAGPVELMTDAFDTGVLDIDSDAAGNVYGISVALKRAYRLRPDKSVGTSTFDTNAILGTGIAIQAPGLPSGLLFFTGSGRLYTTEPASIGRDRFLSVQSGVRSCEALRFLTYRPIMGDLVGTRLDTVVAVNPVSGECSTILAGLALSNGLAVDPANNIYVADTGTGVVIRIPPVGETATLVEGLESPVGLAYDAPTDRLFVSESNANRVSIIQSPGR